MTRPAYAPDSGRALPPGRGRSGTGLDARELPERAEALTMLLRAHTHLWRDSPFHHPEPAWCRRHPLLAASCLALSDAEVGALTSSGPDLVAWMAGRVPELAGLAALLAVPDLAVPSAAATVGRRLAHVPGRKARQILAFAQSVEGLGLPAPQLIEWCAGKGHLGRLLCDRTDATVLSLEHDPQLCAAGRRLAERNGVRQRFECRDVLAAAAPPEIEGHHVVALHACGDLSRTLLARARSTPPVALDVAPCCYAKTAHGTHVPLAASTPSLPLDPLALRLAVADQPHPAARDARRARRELRSKLAYLDLRTGCSDIPRSAPLNSTPRSWSGLDLPAWCRRAAARDGITLPAAPDWTTIEAEAAMAAARFARLNLPRLAFRRAIELWIVIDQVRWLDALGYRVRLGTFCPPSETPRNLLVSARAA